tara:strand:+ start:178 stop:441 length:264 start_codon:yes stop_codon:yes gene_type:complete
MKTNRNEPCPCGSEQKYKNCCGKKGLQLSKEQKYIKWIISICILIFLFVTTFGVIDSFSSDKPDMEAYKCDNPNCNRIHYRPVSEQN